MRAYDDFALSIDSREYVLLVLLDLSAAFETVDQLFPALKAITSPFWH